MTVDAFPQTAKNRLPWRAAAARAATTATRATHRRASGTGRSTFVRYCCLLLVVACPAATAVAGGERREIPLASDPRHVLAIPAGFEAPGGKADVLVNFHSSPEFAVSSVRRAGLNCVVVNIQYGGLSSAYRRPFSKDRRLFGAILSEALAALREEIDDGDDVRWGRVTIASFSAGFGAVREILKDDEYFELVEGLLMIDSLYCGYVGDEAGDAPGTILPGKVDPGLMSDFVRFAEAAAAGKKTMIVTHCELPTPGYASTRETADYLLKRLDLAATPTDAVIKPVGEEGRGLQLTRTARRNGFALFGTPGRQGEAHIAHLRAMPHWLGELPLAKRRG